MKNPDSTNTRKGHGRQVSFIIERNRVENYTDWMKYRVHYHSPVHKQLIYVAKMPEWEGYTTEVCNLLSMHSPSYYYDLLEPITSRIDMWETQYMHVMDNIQSKVG